MSGNDLLILMPLAAAFSIATAIAGHMYYGATVHFWSHQFKGAGSVATTLLVSMLTCLALAGLYLGYIALSNIFDAPQFWDQLVPSMIFFWIIVQVSMDRTFRIYESRLRLIGYSGT
jgi:hypothetical protein